jgi:hypothetical protein
MKTICSTKVIILFLLLCSTEVKAQTMQTKLNQVELMKQWIGSWRTEGTYLTSEMHSYGIDGLEGSQKTQVNDSIVSEYKIIFGYDKKSDKYISAGISKYSTGVILMVFWFTSGNICERVPFEYISNPDQATSRGRIEFKSKDLMVGTFTEKNKPDRTYRIIREKK